MEVAQSLNGTFCSPFTTTVCTLTSSYRQSENRIRNLRELRLTVTMLVKDRDRFEAEEFRKVQASILNDLYSMS